MSTDTGVYDETQQVTVNVRTFACENYNGILKVMQDTGILAERAVSLSGLEDIQIILGPFAAGEYSFMVRLENGEGIVSQRQCTFRVIDAQAPAVPAGLAVALSGKTARLTWSANAEPDLLGYNVYRNGVKLNVVPFRRTFFDNEIVVSGVSYTYSISAVDRANNESVQSAGVSVILDSRPPVITMTPSGNITSARPVTLTYTVTDNIDPSPIVQATHESGKTFSIDGSYDIRIAATDAQGNKAEKAISIIIENGAPLPVGFTAYDAKTGQAVVLDWQWYEETPNVDSYRIYQNETDFTSVEGMTPVASVPKGTFNYTKTGLTNGTQYYFTIVAVDQSGNMNPSVVALPVIPTDGKGNVFVTSTPEGAKVYLGGNYAYQGSYQGVTPLTVSGLPEGIAFFQIFDSGFEPDYTQKIDVIAGATSDIASYLKHSRNFSFTTSSKIQSEEGDLNFGRSAKPFIIDWNSDGLMDIITGEGGGCVNLFINKGTAQNPVFGSSKPVKALAMPLCVSGNAAPFVIDWNDDGLKDLLVGTSDGTVLLFIADTSDITPPVPDVETLPSLEGECFVTVTTVPTATDNYAGQVSGSTTDPLTYTVQGTYTIVWTYDDGNGNQSTQQQAVIVDDKTAPQPNVETLPVLEGECGVTVTTVPTATDNCAGQVTATTTDPMSYTAQGTYTIIWIYSDGNGNVSTQTQQVVVKDNTAPVADVPQLPQLTGECSVQVPTTPTATDNCVGAVTAATTDPLSYTAQGTYTITWTYSDGNGNTSTQTQQVVVKDNTGPVADVPQLPQLTGECSVQVATTPTATDNCVGAVTATTTDPLSYTAQGTYTITWTYSDGNGNVSTQTQQVVVKDNTAPVADVPQLPQLTGECSVQVSTTPTATDNCVGQVTATTTNPLSYTAQGTYTITWTYNDGHGNSTTQQQIVIVKFAPEAVLYSKQDLYIGPRTRINNGSVKSDSYVLADAEDTLYGDILSAGTALVRTRSVIHGDVFTHGTSSIESNVVIDKVRKNGVNVDIHTIPTKTVSVGTSDISVSSYSTYTLNPGNYRDIVVNQGATLILKKGVYNFRNLTVYWDAKLKIDITTIP